MFHRLFKELAEHDVLMVLGVLSVLAFLATLALVPFVLTRLPTDYLTCAEGSNPGRPLVRVLKNGLGVFVILVGVMMLILPGQGLLTIVLGLGLVDFPGRRRFEIAVLSRPTVLKTVNRLRRRASRAPLEIPHRD